MELNCPKCMAPMRAYERNGISVDQCTGCRGIFLDRGELEHLIDAEESFNQSSRPAPQAPSYSQPQYSQPQYSQPQYSGKKKKSFLSEILDF